MAILWKPHPGPQTEFLRRTEFEVLFGGAAGPGKTDCLIMDPVRDVDKRGFKALLVRRTFPQLQEIIDRCHVYYPALGGIWKATENRWHFPSGAWIQLGHCQHEDDRYNYQGREYSSIGFDELSQFTEKQYLYLHSRCRSTIPGLSPRVRSTSNPGGPGHSWVKSRFVSIAPPGTVHRDPYTGLKRVFIPARLTDNPTLLENDPGYVQRLMLLPEQERRMLLDGEWDLFEGQAFSELNRELHGFDFDIPPEWEVYRAFDWGYSKPFVCLWFANDFDDHLYLFKILYGCKDGEPDVGLKWDSRQIAREILRIEQEEIPTRVRPGPADPSIWSKNPRKKPGGHGPSVADEMQREGVTWLRGDNNRILGKQQVHLRLARQEEVDRRSGQIIQGEPGLFIHKDMGDFWRTMGELQLSPNSPEDILEKHAEDHIYDALRYGLMHRPVKPRLKVRSDAGSFQSERRKLIEAKRRAGKYGIPLSEAYRRVS